MNIRLFLEISRDFFDSMYSPFIDLDHDTIPDIFDEEKAFEQISDDDKDELECGCNLCYTTHQILLFINPRIYKKINVNKID
jgi:hypothetical protein